MKSQFIKDLKDGESVSSYFGVSSKAIRKTKTGSDYIDLVLIDKTGSISAKVWDDVEKFKDIFSAGEPVAVKGQVVTYNEELQIKVENIRRVEPAVDELHGYQLSDLIRVTDKDIDEMWQEVQEFIESIKNFHLKDLVNSIYSEFSEQIKEFPASMKLHHAYRGGFLEHTNSLCHLADGVCRVYSELNRDLIMAGVLLHDIGKMKELYPGLSTNYTDEGNFIGHVVLGRDMVIESIRRGGKEFPDTLRLQLEHIILSHHGRREWESPKEPQFPEALIVSYIDEIDTRLHQMEMDISSDQQEGIWTSKSNYFRRVLFKGGANEHQK